MTEPTTFSAFIFVLGCSLVARADAPPSRYVVSNGTVYDTRTKLTWQQAVDPNTHTQTDAVSYCGALTLASGGWRLPKISELLTLVDPLQTHSPAIDPHAFPNTPSNNFWSATASVSSGSYYWYVRFTDGEGGYFGATASQSFYVRCVR